MVELRSVVLNSPDTRGLATFSSHLAGWTYFRFEDDWIAPTTYDGSRIGFQTAPDHVPRQWPDPSHPQQAHLDLAGARPCRRYRAGVELGGTPLSKDDTWHTLPDPAGHPLDLWLNEEDPKAILMGVMLDRPDAVGLSRCYSQLLGKPLTYEGEGVAMIGEDGGRPILFQQVETYTPPQRPDPGHPQQIHLDVRVDDIEATEQAALAIGSTRLPGDGINRRVSGNPVAKPFCLVWSTS